MGIRRVSEAPSASRDILKSKLEKYPAIEKLTAMAPMVFPAWETPFANPLFRLVRWLTNFMPEWKLSAQPKPNIIPSLKNTWIVIFQLFKWWLTDATYGKNSIEAISTKLAEIRAKTMTNAPNTAVRANPILCPRKGTMRAVKNADWFFFILELSYNQERTHKVEHKVHRWGHQNCQSLIHVWPSF